MRLRVIIFILNVVLAYSVSMSNNVDNRVWYVYRVTESPERWSMFASTDNKLQDREFVDKESMYKFLYDSLYYLANPMYVRSYEYQYDGSPDTVIFGTRIPYKLIYKDRFEENDDILDKCLQFSGVYNFDGDRAATSLEGCRIEAYMYFVPKEDLYFDGHDLDLQGRQTPRAAVVIDNLINVVNHNEDGCHEDQIAQTSTMKDTAKAVARRQGMCFMYVTSSLNPNDGCIWYYVDNKIVQEKYKDGVIVDKRSIDYNRNPAWLNSYRKDAYLNMLYMNMYPVYLDGPELTIFKSDEEGITSSLVLPAIEGIYKTPGLDLFLDNLVGDIYEFELVPIPTNPDLDNADPYQDFLERFIKE